MLRLHGKLPVLNSTAEASYLVVVTKSDDLPQVLRKRRALLRKSAEEGKGYKAILTKQQPNHEVCGDSDIFRISDEYDYLDEGDIIRLDSQSGSFRCLYRKNSPHNTILLTEQCDHYCLMCSQPPKEIDDSWLLTEAF